MSYRSISGITWDILSQKIIKLKGFFLFCLIVLEWLWLKDFFMPHRKRAYKMWRPSPHHSINFIAYTIVPFYGLTPEKNLVFSSVIPSKLTKCKFWHSSDFYRLLVVSIRPSNFQDNMTQIRDKKNSAPKLMAVFSGRSPLLYVCDRPSCHTHTGCIPGGSDRDPAWLASNNIVPTK